MNREEYAQSVPSRQMERDILAASISRISYWEAKMAYLVMKCPYCSVNRMAMNVVCASPTNEGDINADYVRYNVMIECPGCSKALVVDMASYVFHAPDQINGEVTQPSFRVMSFHILDSDVPEHLDPGVADDYKEAVNNLNSGSYTSAGIMFRRVLEQATLVLDQSLQADSLYVRIKKLAEASTISEELRESADIIRLQGNTAAHESRENFTEVQARHLQEFAELFLTYTFTLPAKIKAYHDSVKEARLADPSEK